MPCNILQRMEWLCGWLFSCSFGGKLCRCVIGQPRHMASRNMSSLDILVSLSSLYYIAASIINQSHKHKSPNIKREFSISPCLCLIGLPSKGHITKSTFFCFSPKFPFSPNSISDPALIFSDHFLKISSQNFFSSIFISLH